MIAWRTIILFFVLAAIGGAIFYLNSMKTKYPLDAIPKNAIIPPVNDLSSSKAEPVAQSHTAKNFPRAKELVGISGFINTEPFKLADIIGKKVILVDFWTYSCINCQRTIPYLNAWYEKYKDKGFLIVGVHSPEFQFEREYSNVLAAVKKFGIQYPVVLDNDMATWNAYSNRYWPHKYLIDVDGFIVYDHIGEGGYDETERRIQEALAERTQRQNIQETIDTKIAKPKNVTEIDFSQVKSPETYFGFLRNANFGNGTRSIGGIQEVIIPAPAERRQNILYLGGSWDIQGEFAENHSADARIIFSYHAKNVYLVASGKKPVKIRVLRDGKEVALSFAGEDVSRDGKGTAAIAEERLYKLIEDSSYASHTLEIIIDGEGLRAFTFTFG